MCWTRCGCRGGCTSESCGGQPDDVLDVSDWCLRVQDKLPPFPVIRLFRMPEWPPHLQTLLPSTLLHRLFQIRADEPRILPSLIGRVGRVGGRCLSRTVDEACTRRSGPRCRVARFEGLSLSATPRRW
jgi:hypothetical protein